MPSLKKMTMADLCFIVAGFALSAASLRLSLADPHFATSTSKPAIFGYMATAAVFLSPLSATCAVLAMARTRRDDWAFHPAIVVGLSALFLTVGVLIPSVVWHARGLADGVSLSGRHLRAYATELRADLSKFLAAWFFVRIVAGGLRKPDDWLQFAGWGIGVCWVGLGFIAYLMRIF